jgi:hypothetical protein
VDEIGREARQPVKMTLSPAVFDGNVLAVNVAGFRQSFAKSGLDVRVRIQCSDIEETDHRLGRLLRACRQRTKCRSAQHSDEFASSSAALGFEA